MQSTSSSIWTQVIKSISYDDNDYAIGVKFYQHINEKWMNH